MDNRPYGVISFLDTDGELGESEAIPYLWVFQNETRAYWPDFSKKGTTDQRTRMIMTLAKPDKNWPSYPIKLRHRFATYEKARAAAKKQNEGDDTVVTEPSDLDRLKRKRKMPARFLESDDDLPPKALEKKCQKKRKIVTDTDTEEEDEEDDNLINKVQNLLRNAKPVKKPGNKSSKVKIQASKKTSSDDQISRTSTSNVKISQIMSPQKTITTDSSIFKKLVPNTSGNIQSLKKTSSNVADQIGPGPSTSNIKIVKIIPANQKISVNPPSMKQFVSSTCGNVQASKKTSTDDQSPSCSTSNAKVIRIIPPNQKIVSKSILRPLVLNTAGVQITENIVQAPKTQTVRQLNNSAVQENTLENTLAEEIMDSISATQIDEGYNGFDDGGNRSDFEGSNLFDIGESNASDSEGKNVSDVEGNNVSDIEGNNVSHDERSDGSHDEGINEIFDEGLNGSGDERNNEFHDLGNKKQLVDQVDQQDSDFTSVHGRGRRLNSNADDTTSMKELKKMFTKYQRLTAESLQEHRQQLDAVLLNQAKILSYLAPEDELFSPLNMPPLKISNEEKFNEFNEFLKHPTNFKAYVKHIQQISMHIPKEDEATGFVLKSVLSNRLARAISWGGRKGKIAFEPSLLNKAICGAMLKNFPNGQLIATRAKIKRWFDTSSQRKIESDDSSENEEAAP